MTQEERIQQLEDKEAIRELCCGLAEAADHGNADALLAPMKEDVFYDIGPFGSWSGCEPTRAWLEGFWTQTEFRIHRVDNAVITVGDNRPSTRMYFDCALGFAGQSVVANGHYREDLEKNDGRWQVVRRRTGITYFCPLLEGWAKMRILQLG